MKFNRVLSIVLAGILLALSLASCGTVAPEIKVTVQVYTNAPETATEDDIILNVEVPLQTAEPTVLDAVLEAFIVNEISYRLSDDQASIADIKDYTDYTEPGTGIAHYWMYYLNAAEPTTGKASANAIQDGDVISYYYVAFDPATAK